MGDLKCFFWKSLPHSALPYINYGSTEILLILLGLFMATQSDWLTSMGRKSIWGMFYTVFKIATSSIFFFFFPPPTKEHFTCVHRTSVGAKNFNISKWDKTSLWRKIAIFTTGNTMCLLIYLFSLLSSDEIYDHPGPMSWASKLS